MLLVQAYEDIEEPRQRRDIPDGFIGWSSYFVDVPADKSIDSPMAFLAEGEAGQGLRTHYHHVDQFQVVYNGGGTLGSHPLQPGGIHFARAYTPYGPIRNGAHSGVGYITLRAHRDPGARFLPEHREALGKIRGRSPWQVTVMPDYELPTGSDGRAMKPVEGLHDQVGVGAWSFRLAPGARCTAPDPSRGEGQYIVVLRGSLVHGERPRQGLTVVWVSPQEPAFELIAGDEGMEGLILNFPPAGIAAVPDEAAVADPGFKVWTCVLCGFVYDESAGWPEGGIAPGTRWADVPDSFGCPDCSATKVDFEMVEI